MRGDKLPRVAAQASERTEFPQRLPIQDEDPVLHLIRDVQELLLRIRGESQ